MASLDDILTTQKNGVVAINNYNSALNKFAGTTNSLEASTSKVIKTSSGWLASVSIIVAGSTTTFLYDTNVSSGITTGNRIYAIPSTAALGVYQVQVPFSNGLAIAPGTGAIITVNYS